MLLKRIAAEEWRRVLVRPVTAREFCRIASPPLASAKYGRAGIRADRFLEVRAFLPPVRKTLDARRRPDGDL
jgi:hypothetical protein